MRAYLRELLWAAVASIALVISVMLGGALSILAGLSAAVFALAFRELLAAFLESLEPQTRHEKRTMQRITQAIQRNMAELQLKQQSPRAGGES
jgi:hypothetical protein